MDLYRNGHYDDSENVVRLQLRSASCYEDNCVRSVNARRSDLALLVFSNAYALGGFLLSSCLLLVTLFLAEARHVWTAVPIAVLAVAILYFAWLSHNGRVLRRRIYRILERRMIRKGFREEHFRHLCGGACLRLQHRLLFLRYGVHAQYRSTMRRYKGNDLVYLGHPDEELEDELNFGKSADLLRPPSPAASLVRHLDQEA
jgi:hypothetical protein